MTFNAKGTCSWFGGPEDDGVSPSEGLAWIYDISEQPDLFLGYQPEGTTGLARRLNPETDYVACRFYPANNPEAKATMRPLLLTELALVTAQKTGKQLKCRPADWGPHEEKTGRVADLSPHALEYLGIETDDVVSVIFPYTHRFEVAAPTYRAICMSSGHSTKCQGANGYVNEVAEATRIVDTVAVMLRARGVHVETFHDTVSTEQDECLHRITEWHNSKKRDLDISVHLNAYEPTPKPMGTEVCYITQLELATNLSAAIAGVGFIDRGAKKRTDLWFLKQTVMPSVLLEICFVDSKADTNLYHQRYLNICESIATILGGTLQPSKGVQQHDGL